MKNTAFPHKFWRPFLDCMPRLFFRPQYVRFPVHLKGLLIPLWYETLVVNWQNWLFTLFHQSRSILSPNPIGDLHAMPITNITHSAYYTVDMGVSAGDLTRITLDNIHTAYKHICLQGTGSVCVKNYPPEIMQPSSSTRATIVSAENQNISTIVKATFFFCHHYIAWESNHEGNLEMKV